MLLLIAVGFIIFGLYGLYGIYNLYSLAPSLAGGYSTILSLAFCVIYIVAGHSLIRQKPWARVVAQSLLLAWIVLAALIVIILVVFLERLAFSWLLLFFFLQLLPPEAPRASGGVFTWLAGVLQTPIGSRLIILLVGGVSILILWLLYRYLRDHEDLQGEWTPFGLDLRYRGKDLKVYALALLYLSLVSMPVIFPLMRLQAQGRPETPKNVQQRIPKEATPQREDWITTSSVAPDLQSMFLFTAHSGAFQLNLQSGDITALNPAMFTYTKVGEGFPDKVSNRLSPDHQLFLNIGQELISIHDMSKRQINDVLGHPVLFLDAQHLLGLTEDCHFQLTSIQTGQILWKVPALSDAHKGLCPAFVNRASLTTISPARNALYYEIVPSSSPDVVARYVFDLRDRKLIEIQPGQQAQFEGFSTEGDTLYFRLTRPDEAGNHGIIFHIRTTSLQPVSWGGYDRLLFFSTSRDLAVITGQRLSGGQSYQRLIGTQPSQPGKYLWEAEPPPALHFVITPDGRHIFAMKNTHDALVWAALNRETGPGAWQTIPLKKALSPKDLAVLSCDSHNVLLTLQSRQGVEVIWHLDLDIGRIRSKFFSLDAILGSKRT